MAIRGIDVSKYQGKIDFNAVAASGIGFVMIRAGYGMYAHQKDPLFESHYAGSIQAGLPVGAYHYSYARTREEATAEAEVFLSWVQGKHFTYPVAFDLEDSSLDKLSRSALNEIARTFCSRIAQAGYQPMVYANKYWLLNKLSPEELDCDIWLAHYTDQTNYPGRYTIWQYTSSGNVPGVSGRCDCNWSYREYAQEAQPLPPPANRGYGICLGNRVRVRSGPSTDHAILRHLNVGDEMDVYQREGDFYLVNAGNCQGYVSAQYVAVAAEYGMQYTPGNYQITCSRLNVREGPGKSYRVKTLQELSRSAQAQGGYCLGVVFTAKRVLNQKDQAWALTPSGWVCLENADGSYCKRSG